MNCFKKTNYFFQIFIVFMLPAAILQANHEKPYEYRTSVSILLENKKIIITTFPKIGSLSLIKWAMAGSGFADLYGIDVKLPSLYYDPSDPYAILNLQPKLTSEFFQIYCGKDELNWHSVFHDINCFFNLYNNSLFSELIDDTSYEKYIIIRNVYDRLITAYVNHYATFKNVLIRMNYLSVGEEYSFKDLIKFIYSSGYKDEHFSPYSQLIPLELKNRISLFKVIRLENLSSEIDRLSKEKNVSTLITDIPNVHKNILFGDAMYSRVYDLPLPFMDKGAPLRDKKYWFDEEMKQQVLELFYDDFELFGINLDRLN